MAFKCYYLGLYTLLLLNLVLAEDFYSFSIKDYDGTTVNLDKFRGKVTLVVNVASHCGYTEGTYKALTRLHDILSYEGYFSVLAFPCNQFGEQEPASSEEIFKAMTEEYEVEFPIYGKINVTGTDADPAFKNLIEQSSVVPDWNFYKYLVNENGKVIETYGTRMTIEEMFDDIQAAITKAKESPLPQEKSESIDDDLIDEKDEL